MGCCCEQIPNASASILLNREVIAVNQDRLVQQGRRVSNYGGVCPRCFRYQHISPFYDVYLSVELGI